VSEWLLFDFKWAILQLYHGANMLLYYEIISVLYLTNMLNWSFIVLAQSKES